MLSKLTTENKTMKIGVIALLAIVFEVVIAFIGCGPELIECPENSDSVTAKVGRLKSGTLYKLGVVSVRYNEAALQQTDLTDDVPLEAVNDFFVKKGYTPKVVGSFLGYEVVDIGKDVDPKPMLRKLRSVPGIQQADLHGLVSTSTWLERLTEPLGAGYVDELPVIEPAIIEVGRLEDGSLYEFGMVLVQYDEFTFKQRSSTIDNTLMEAVNNFFVSKGYVPKVTELIAGFIVIHIGECVDTAPMLEELGTIPSVVSARLNILHTVLEVWSGELDIPGASL